MWQSLLSSKSRTNIWTKFHCCFFGHAGLLMASTHWPSLASQFKIYNVSILLQAATWSLMIAPKTGLQVLLQQICFNRLQTFLWMFLPHAGDAKMHHSTSFPSHWKGRKRNLHLFCIGFQVRCTQFIRKRKCLFSFAIYEGMWKADFIVTHRFPPVPQKGPPKPPLLNCCFQCTEFHLFSLC